MTFGAFCPLPIRLSDHPHGLSARQHARICADMVAMVRSLPLAVVRVHTGTGAIGFASGQFGFQKPTVTVNAIGEVTIEWERGYTDVFGGSAAMRIRSARAGANGRAILPTVELLSARSVKVHSFAAGPWIKAGAEVTVSVY